MNIFVKMFDNKIVIDNAGAFMPPTTAETVYDAHNPRNTNMMWALYYFDYVQCAFEGTRRMRQGMLDANLPEPTFVQKQIWTFRFLLLYIITWNIVATLLEQKLLTELIRKFMRVFLN
jgi:ATP-dependent DNA helicase RecG